MPYRLSPIAYLLPIAGGEYCSVVVTYRGHGERVRASCASCAAAFLEFPEPVSAKSRPRTSIGKVAGADLLVLLDALMPRCGVPPCLRVCWCMIARCCVGEQRGMTACVLCAVIAGCRGGGGSVIFRSARWRAGAPGAAAASSQQALPSHRPSGARCHDE